MLPSSPTVSHSSSELSLAEGCDWGFASSAGISISISNGPLDRLREFVLSAVRTVICNNLTSCHRTVHALWCVKCLQICCNIHIVTSMQNGVNMCLMQHNFAIIPDAQQQSTNTVPTCMPTCVHFTHAHWLPQTIQCTEMADSQKGFTLVDLDWQCKPKTRGSNHLHPKLPWPLYLPQSAGCIPDRHPRQFGGWVPHPPLLLHSPRPSSSPSPACQTHMAQAAGHDIAN